MWKTIKYDEFYLHAYDTAFEVRLSLARYIDFYNVRWPLRALDHATPYEFCFNALPVPMAA